MLSIMLLSPYHLRSTAVHGGHSHPAFIVRLGRRSETQDGKIVQHSGDSYMQRYDCRVLFHVVSFYLLEQLIPPAQVDPPGFDRPTNSTSSLSHLYSLILEAGQYARPSNQQLLGFLRGRPDRGLPHSVWCIIIAVRYSTDVGGNNAALHTDG
jgi:hypothetical protein